MVHCLLARKIYDEKRKKQTTMDVSLKRVTPLQEETQAGPSGGVPEEGIVITGDNGSMRVIAPEDLPVGRDVKMEDRGIDDPDPE